MGKLFNHILLWLHPFAFSLSVNVIFKNFSMFSSPFLFLFKDIRVVVQRGLWFEDPISPNIYHQRCFTDLPIFMATLWHLCQLFQFPKSKEIRCLSSALFCDSSEIWYSRGTWLQKLQLSCPFHFTVWILLPKLLSLMKQISKMSWEYGERRVNSNFLCRQLNIGGRIWSRWRMCEILIEKWNGRQC